MLRLSLDLLDRVPAADSFELRINLAKARYLRAEKLAERHRLRLASPDEIDEARVTLESVLRDLASIGGRVDRQVRIQEQRLNRDGPSDPASIRDRLSEARRLRSLAMYYGGWSGYYLALINNRVDLLDDALERFAYLLNAEHQEPTLERLPRSMLRYEHVARSAVGVALCRSMQGEHVQAQLWLDEVDAAEGLSESVRTQLVPRRLVVLAGAKRWDSFAVLARRERRAADGVDSPLPVDLARLVAVLALEGVREYPVGDSRRWAVEPMVQLAVGDLVTMGEIAHVLDLTKRFGTLPLGETGFIARYVRGLRAFEDVRVAHRALAAESGGDAEVPTADPALANRYLATSDLLSQALEAEDAGRYAEERANAALLRGMAEYYRDRPVEAAALFEEAIELAQGRDRREQASWLRVIAIDRAVELDESPTLIAQRDEAATFYVQEFPTGERAARLLLRLAGAGLADDATAAGVLLAVPPESPLYAVARRQAATLLYRLCRSTRGSERDDHAATFLSVASELIEAERRIVISAGEDEATEAAKTAVILVRQLLDIALGTTAPDLGRAEGALRVLDDMLSRLGRAAGELDPQINAEMTYRRLQIATFKGRLDEADDLALLLRAGGGRFAAASDRFLFNHALKAWDGGEPDDATATRLVDHGVRVLTPAQGGPPVLDTSTESAVADVIAIAAVHLWRAAQDEARRDLALRLDRLAIDEGHATERRLRRYAGLAEEAGQPEPALEAWRLLSSGLDPSDEGWYEARYNTIRLLIEVDVGRAHNAMLQHRTLYPDLGPEPWGERFRALMVRLEAIGPGSGTGGVEP